MALVGGESTQVSTAQGASSGAQVVQAFMRFLGNLASIPSVQRIAYSGEDDALQIWVLLREDVPDDAERVFRMEYDFARSPEGFPFDLQVATLSELDTNQLSLMHTLVDRP